MKTTSVENHALVSSAHANADAGRRPHIAAIDGLRGVAVLIVLMSHLTISLGHSTRIGSFVLKLLGAGWWGVDLFFVLSGFLITGILLDARGKQNYFRAFYARRVLRIFPLYYGLLAVIFIIMPHVASISPQQQQVASRQGWVWSYLTNFGVSAHGWQVFHGGRIDFGHLWSLAVEEHFYLVWPLVVLVCSPRRLMQVCIAIIIAALASRCFCFFELHNTVAVYALTPCRMDSLAIGALVALLLRQATTDERALASLRRWATPFAFATGVAFLILLLIRRDFSEDDAVTGTIGFCVVDAFCASLLLLAVLLPRSSVLSRSFSSPLLRSFGKYSYAIYLLDPFVESFYLRWFGPNVFGPRVHSQLLGAVLYVGLAAGCAWMIGLVSWHVYEQHFIRLKKFFAFSGERDSQPRSQFLHPSINEIPAPYAFARGGI